MTILMWVGVMLLTIWEMFHGRISLKQEVLVLPVDFWSGLRLKLMYISHCKYQVRLHSSRWFPAACAAAIVHRDNIFRLYKQNESSESKVKFRKAINCYKKVLQAVKLAYANRTKESITSPKLSS